jgi:hypothetical protein
VISSVTTVNLLSVFGRNVVLIARLPRSSKSARPLIPDAVEIAAMQID